jgi:hypothetical protein
VERRNEIEHFVVTFIPATDSAFHVHEQLDSSYSLQGTMTGKHLLLKLKDTFVCWQLACDSQRWHKYVWFKRSIKSNCEEADPIRQTHHCIIHHENAEFFSGDKRSQNRCDLNKGLQCSQPLKRPSVTIFSIINRKELKN